MARRPLCFVLMPFGNKSAGGTKPINFDAVYSKLIKPAIDAAGLEAIRADEEEAGGIIHKPMFERLVLCEYAIADLTTANANVFYELGVRHAAKPRTTVLMFAEGHGRLPFDVAQLRALPYAIGRNGGPTDVEASIVQLVDKLESAKRGSEKDSPIYQLLDDYPDVAHEKTDVFRDRIAYAAEVKQRLFEARKSGHGALLEIEKSLGNLHDEEAGVIIDLFLSYRSVGAWTDMVRVFESMSAALASTVLVREQLALALNRMKRGDRAEQILTELLEERGPSSETYGILGRVYKDRWEAAKDKGEKIAASGFLRQAIDAYRNGFEADWRDAYPGVNALTLMQIANEEDTRLPELRPVVEYAVKRKMALGDPDYWDFATLLELAVLRGDRNRASDLLPDVVSRIREKWEAETTARNLQLIIDALQPDDERKNWISEMCEALKSSDGK